VRVFVVPILDLHTGSSERKYTKLLALLGQAGTVTPPFPPQEMCPCGSGDLFEACCGPLHDDTAVAPTAERLMRSRYSAYVVGDVKYLLATWHPSTRPQSLHLETGTGWRGLTILRTHQGGPEHSRGTVEFEAFYAGGSQHENSTFVREDGRWFYVAAL